MKKTIYVHAELADWKDEGYLLQYWDRDMGERCGPLVAKLEVEFDLPSKTDLANGFVAALRKEQQKVRAEAEVKANAIEDRISQLLALEDRSQS
ncbi:MAG TPA: hypothetical protein VK629_12920 [Steroidobacteraceae bacterium]|nr:hypothetical protein [Steroidobacteraceae bacterium]